MIFESPFTDYFLPDYKGLNPKYFGHEGFLGQSIHQIDSWSQLEGINVAILSVPETRNAYEGSFSCNFHPVKEHLYSLANVASLKIADLGQLVKGNQLNDTYQALTEVVSYLHKQNIALLVLGGTHDLTIPISKGIDRRFKKANITIIDNRFDIVETTDLHSKGFVTALSEQKHTNITLAGYQNYFVTEGQVEMANALDIISFRLGKIRQSLRDFEPVVRDTDFLSFDLAALRMNDFSATNYPSPNGLYAEEACHLAKFAGLSDRMGILGLFELNSEMPQGEQASLLVAQMAWHFLSGMSERHNDYPKCSLEKYKKIYVKSELLKTDVVFYQNEVNNRFWIEIPAIKGSEPLILACSESDYRQICNNEIPDRLWITLQRRV